MNKDAETYATTCDVCQKINMDHRAKMGALRPAHIPPRPFATVSMDMVTGLPPSGEQGYTAILVIVDKLTKFTIIIPTHTTLLQYFTLPGLFHVESMEWGVDCRNSRWIPWNGGWIPWNG